MLRVKERAAGEIAEPFRLSKTTISEHLRALRSAGLVVERDQGPRRIYRLVPDRIRELDQWVRSYRSLWAGRIG